MMAESERLTDFFPDFNVVAWSVACREMSVRAAHGNYDATVAVLKRFFQSTKRDFLTLDSHVGLALPVRTANALESSGYYTLRSVKNAGPNRVIGTCSGLGPVMVDEMFRMIRQVENHELLEPIGDDDIELIDESDLATAAEIETYEQKIKQTRRMNGMSTGYSNVGGGSTTDKIKNALAVLTADQSQTIEVIDKEIAELKKQVSELRNVRRMLAVQSTDKKQYKVSDKTLSNEELIYQFVMSKGGTAAMADIGEEMQLIPIQIGKAIASSKRLKKQGKIVHAI